MEMVFRKIEYLIEGDAQQQVKLNQAPWTTDKLLRKIAKHLLFFLIAVIIANLFLSYVIGVDAVFDIMREPVSQHQAGFAAMLVFSGLFYGVFSFMREQVCTTICPYGRMQGVLLVPESVVIIYDYIRGEPRGKRRKSNHQEMTHALPVVATETPVAKTGDCIDCNRCVNVCPTGIDIRNGTQLECVNCTACIDACDFVMDKIGKPRGLIRYDSAERVRTGSRKLFHPRAIAYASLLMLLLVLQAFLLSQRGKVEALVLKVPGQLYQQLDDGRYRNVYNWEIVNKSGSDIRQIRFRVTEPAGAQVTLVGKDADETIDLERAGMAKGVMLIDLPAGALRQTKVTLRLEVLRNDQTLDRITTNFLGPMQPARR
jgi:cytochrome c oxidase accessory protein FixG